MPKYDPEACKKELEVVEENIRRFQDALAVQYAYKAELEQIIKEAEKNKAQADEG